MKIKAVIFDLDGTLFDTLGDIAAGASYALEKFGKPIPSFEEYRTYIGDGPKTLIQRALKGEVSEEEFREIYDCYFDYYLSHPAERTVLYPEIVPVLDYCREEGLRMAVNTNKQEEIAEVLVREKLADYPFEAVLGQRDTLPAKPDPTGALRIAEKFSCKPCETVFVGDSFQDALTAKNAGMIPFNVLWGYQSEEEIRGRIESRFFKDGESLVEALKRIGNSE